MKKQSWNLSILCFILLLVWTTSCKKKTDDSTSNSDSPSAVTAAVTTASAGTIGSTASISGGTISSDGGATVTARGVCYSTSANPTIGGNKTSDGTGTGTFTSIISGLSTLTTYYVRAYATNAAGTAYGNQISFTTLPPGPPTLTTVDIGAISTTSATSGGNIISDGGLTVTDRGVCYGTSSNPTISGSTTSDGDGPGAFTSSLSGLTPMTTYYVRAYATNSAGTAYGNEYSFYSAITDIDGNVYTSVIIGTQEWMVENLKVTKYRDGTLIPNTTDNTTWQNYLFNPTGAWRNYLDLTSNGTTYGKLYNWYAATDSRGLAPKGWHIPTDDEFATLENNVDFSGPAYAGGKMKSTGTTLWLTPNTSATNTSGFTGLPGGFCDPNGDFANLRYTGAWWTATPGNTAYYGYYHYLIYNSNQAIKYNCYKTQGMSIRCVRD